jgi:nascent polypeptide-associated complex subunit alpha
MAQPIINKILKSHLNPLFINKQGKEKILITTTLSLCENRDDETMMPGRMNSRQLAQMMKRFGINVKDIENVEKVIIQTDTKEYVFDSAEVTVMEAQGQKTFQIVGNPLIRTRGAESQDAQKEDIKLIMEQTGKSEAEVRKALKETNGDLAEAILKLTQSE